MGHWPSNIYSSTIHSSQDTETNQIVYEMMNPENIVDLLSGIVLIQKRKMVLCFSLTYMWTLLEIENGESRDIFGSEC